MVVCSEKHIHAIQIHLDQVSDIAQQLRVDRQTAVQLRVGFGDQTHGELVLVHDHRRTKHRPVRQQLEGQRRRNLGTHDEGKKIIKETTTMGKVKSKKET